MIPYQQIIELVISFIAGGGIVGIVTIKSKSRKEKGQADQEIAISWQKQQQVYQSIIDDLTKYTDRIKTNNEQYEKEIDGLKNINSNLQLKIESLQTDVQNLKSEVQKNAARLTLIQPFCCSVRNCPNRQWTDTYDEKL